MKPLTYWCWVCPYYKNPLKEPWSKLYKKGFRVIKVNILPEK